MKIDTHAVLERINFLLCRPYITRYANTLRAPLGHRLQRQVTSYPLPGNIRYVSNRALHSIRNCSPAQLFARMKECGLIIRGICVLPSCSPVSSMSATRVCGVQFDPHLYTCSIIAFNFRNHGGSMHVVDSRY